MKPVRIIPRLDIKGPNLVKGISLEGLRVLGNPNSFAKLYYKQGADELIYQDTVASLYGRNNLMDVVNKTAKEIFIPLTVGGGIRSLDDIRNALKAGADKVIINTKATSKPQFINQACEIFGSSTIVGAIEVSKNHKNEYLVYTNNGREHTGKNPIKWAIELQKRGVGEIVLTSIDNEGTGRGFDETLIKKIREKIDISLVVHGGCGSKNDVKKVIMKYDVDGVCISSLFHYFYSKKIKNKIDHNKSEGNYDYLNNKTFKFNFKSQSIPSLKKYLKKNKILIRDEIN